MLKLPTATYIAPTIGAPIIEPIPCTKYITPSVEVKLSSPRKNKSSFCDQNQDNVPAFVYMSIEFLFTVESEREVCGCLSKKKAVIAS